MDGERRRRWSIEEKREIVAESLRPGVKPSEIIHRHGITSGQLYAWRQQLTRRIGGELARAGDQAQPAPSFARVEVVSQPQENTTPAAETPLARPSVQVPLSAVSRMRGLIEIVLPGGVSVRVDAQVDDRALRYVLGALRER
jgi:transposase